MKKSVIFLISIFVVFSSCKSKEEEENKEEDARILFSESIELIKSYTIKIQNAPDSATFDSLCDLFDKKIVDLNYSFPPNTDLKLTEQENDSLFYMLQTLKTVKANKFKKDLNEATDTVKDSKEVKKK